ncbi:hypothetical protein QQ045_008594 [Rhodiola kirilowii]
MEIEASSSSSHAESIFQANGTLFGVHLTIPPVPIPPQSFNHDSDLPVRVANLNPESVNGPGVAGKNSSLKVRKKRSVLVNGVLPSASSSSALRARVRGMSMRRNPRIDLGSNPRRRSEVDALALPLGMSIAAVFAQVLVTREVADANAYIDNLSEMCSSAVKEALDTVFGEKFDCFVGNFEKSFRSTLRTITLINESSMSKGRSYQSRQKMMRTRGTFKTRTTSGNNIVDQSIHRTNDYVSEITHSFDESEDSISVLGNLRNLGFSLHQQTRQELVCVSPIRTSSAIDSSVVSTFKKSVVEQTRANDLKAYEISLLMEKLKFKETKLALESESNYLDRFKLSMGLSKASFKAEKFKTQLEDTRHAELLRSCNDCLVGSLLITSGSFMYGAYVHSYKRINEATASCTPSKTSKSWWIPKSFDAVSSGFQTLSCQLQVVSRMTFGFLMILAITYILLQRTAGPRQSMPITFILLILGVACGLSGQLCMDTLGGDGSIWLCFWEALCSIHFIANVFTSSLFTFLYGPINVNLDIKSRKSYSYLSRRVIFYAITLIILPLTCGLIPFASAAEWKDHFLALVTNAFIS